MALTIKQEAELFRLDRKNGDSLRIVRTKAQTDEGQDVAWYSIEVGTGEPADFHAKHKVTIRSRELLDVVKALHHACFGDPPPGAKLDIDLELDKHELPF